MFLQDGTLTQNLLSLHYDGYEDYRADRTAVLNAAALKLISMLFTSWYFAFCISGDCEKSIGTQKGSYSDYSGLPAAVCHEKANLYRF